MTRHRLMLGILLLLGSKLLPEPIDAAALLLSGILIVTYGWASDRGPQKWWWLCCAFLAILVFAVLNLLSQDQVFFRRFLGALFLMLLTAGLAPTFVGLAKVSRRAAGAIVDGIRLLMEMRRASTGAR